MAEAARRLAHLEDSKHLRKGKSTVVSKWVDWIRLKVWMINDVNMTKHVKLLGCERWWYAVSRRITSPAISFDHAEPTITTPKHFESIWGMPPSFGWAVFGMILELTHTYYFGPVFDLCKPSLASYKYVVVRQTSSTGMSLQQRHVKRACIKWCAVALHTGCKKQQSVLWSYIWSSILQHYQL